MNINGKKLYRSRYDKKFAGVCGGLAEFFDMDASLVRLITLLLIIPGGMSIWVYIIAAFIIPEEPSNGFDNNGFGGNNGQNGNDGYNGNNGGYDQ